MVKRKTTTKTQRRASTSKARKHQRRSGKADRLGYVLFLSFVFLTASIFYRAYDRQGRPSTEVADVVTVSDPGLGATNELPLARDSERLGSPGSAGTTEPTPEANISRQAEIRSVSDQAIATAYDGSVQLDLDIKGKRFSVPAKLTIKTLEPGVIAYDFTAQGTVEYRIDKADAVIPIRYDLRGNFRGTLVEGVLQARGKASTSLSADVPAVYAVFMSQELKDKINSVSLGTGTAEGSLSVSKLSGSIQLDAGGYKATGTWWAE